MIDDPSLHVKMEAVYTVLNAVGGGTPTQLRTLVDMGCMEPLCRVLNLQLGQAAQPVFGAKLLNLRRQTLSVIERVLKVGDDDADAAFAEATKDACVWGSSYSQKNQMAACIDRAGGRATIEAMQQHEDPECRAKATDITQSYYVALHGQDRRCQGRAACVAS